MKNSKKFLIIPTALLILIFTFYLGRHFFNRLIPRTGLKGISQYISYNPGDEIDSLNGVIVYYNGTISNDFGRNLTKDNYNLGKKFQCVEFVKRYYYQRLHHKMPDSWGDAKDYFNPLLKDGDSNSNRGLIQFSNKSHSKPKVEDIIVFGASNYNPFGHVAIISRVTDNSIEIIQQNPGPTSKSRAIYNLSFNKGYWFVESDKVLGWLRK